MPAEVRDEILILCVFGGRSVQTLKLTLIALVIIFMSAVELEHYSLKIEQMGVILIGYGGSWFYLLEGMTKYIVSGPMTSFSSHRFPCHMPQLATCRTLVALHGIDKYLKVGSIWRSCRVNSCS